MRSPVGAGLPAKGPSASLKKPDKKKPPPNSLRIGNAMSWTRASCFSDQSLRNGFHRDAAFNRGGATIDIFKPLDIVFTQITARLDFDDFQRNLARVAQAVDRGNRDVGRLVFTQQEHVFVAGHFGGAADHDPVFGAVLVHLQRQARARFDRDVLDLETPAHVHRVVGAPRTIDFAVVLGFAAALFVESVDHLFHALDRVLVGDHHGVLGFDDHDVFQADHRHQFTVAVDHAVSAVLDNHVTFGDVAVGVFFIHFPQRRPAPDITPAGGQRHDAGTLGFFHHCVIDGVVRAAGEGGFVEGDGVGILLAALKGQQAGVVDVRVVLFQLFEEAAGAEQEHAAVPEITAGLDVFGGAFDVGFFDEVRDAADAFGQQRIVGRLDVAVKI